MEPDSQSPDNRVFLILLDSAKNDGKSVLFYSHELSNSSKWDITEFRSLISEAQDRNLPFLLMNDLAK